VQFPDGTEKPMNVFLQDTFGYDYSFRGGVIGILVIFMLGFAGLAVVTFTHLRYQRR
jgi:cytochrome c oxidase subunit IV